MDVQIKRALRFCVLEVPSNINCCWVYWIINCFTGVVYNHVWLPVLSVGYDLRLEVTGNYVPTCTLSIPGQLIYIWNSLLKNSRRNDNCKGCPLKPLKDFILEHRAVPDWRLSLHRILFYSLICGCYKDRNGLKPLTGWAVSCWQGQSLWPLV